MGKIRTDVPLVGREAELERLSRFLAATAEAGPSALLFEGEPGIGKTALWDEGVRLARSLGHRVLTAHPAEAEAKLSFAALGDLVGGVLDELRGHDLPAQQRGALDAALLRGEPLDPAPDLRAVSVALLGVLRALASGGGVLVAIDDVQWIDPPSARALGFAARRLEAEPVAFLATSLGPAAEAPFDLSAERIDRLQLGPLTGDGLRSLFRTRLGAEFPPSTLRQLEELSGGNPFFALEMARASLRGEPAVTGQSVPIPRNLREDLLRHRFAELSKDAREVVLVAAAASRPSLDLVASTNMVSDAAASLDEAVEAGVLERTGPDIRFTHPFFRSAVYADESRERRHALHRALAEVVTDPEERARHLALGADGPDAAVADTLDDASLIAADRGATESAAELAELAARLTPTNDVDAARRRKAAARHHASLGDHERAISLLEQAATDATEEPSGAETRWFLGRMLAIAGDLPRAIDVLTDARARRGAPPTLLADVDAELAIDAWLLGDLDRATRHADLAVGAPASVGEETVSFWPDEETRVDGRLAVAARCRGILAAVKGDLGAGETKIDEAVSRYRSTALRFELGRALLVLGSIRRRRKQKRPAREALDLALDEFERLGNAWWAERATEELSGISGRRPSAGKLTPTERRVARLAAAGRTNREIADVLFMSVRTVEGHLSRVYAKLGIRSRVDLALFPESADDPDGTPP